MTIQWRKVDTDYTTVRYRSADDRFCICDRYWDGTAWLVVDATKYRTRGYATKAALAARTFPTVDEAMAYAETVQ